MRVINGNYRFHVYKGSTLVYNGNNHFIAFMYKVLEKFDKDIWVGDTRKYG